MSLVDTSPATLFGGTWLQIKDKFLLSAGDTYVAETTGGAATHTHTLENGYAKISTRGSSGYAYAQQNNNVASWNPNKDCETADQYNDFHEWSITSGINLGGSTDSSSSLPPYLTVYMWRRIA